MKKKIFLIFSSSTIAGVMLTGCSLAFTPYPSNITKEKTSIKSNINAFNSYKNYKVFTGISIEGKTIEGVLDQLSSYQNVNYVYSSPYHIIFPNNIDVKITNLKELKIATETYTPFTLQYEKKPYNTYAVIAKVKNSRKLKVKKTKGTLEEILKEIANVYNANLIINKNALKKSELASYEDYVLNSNTVFDLEEAVMALHDIFIEYNPYNKSVEVYKYKYIKKVLPGFDRKRIEKYLSGILSYDRTLKTPNSFYIDKDGLIVVKATHSNYFEALKILNTLKELNDKNINFELDYFKVKTIDEIPNSVLVSQIESCGNYKCVEETIENYGKITDWQKNFTTNKSGMILSRQKNSSIEFDYKTSVNSLKGKKFIVNYSMYKLKDNSELIKGTQTVPLNTYIPIYIKTEYKNGKYVGTYYLIRLSSPLF